MGVDLLLEGRGISMNISSFVYTVNESQVIDSSSFPICNIM